MAEVFLRHFHARKFGSQLVFTTASSDASVSWAAGMGPAQIVLDFDATLVTSLEAAMRDPHFVTRGLFANRVVGTDGATIAALPVPIAPAFRDGVPDKLSPPLGDGLTTPRPA